MINSKEALFGFGSLFTWFSGMIELCLYLSSVVGDLQGILIHQMSINHFTVLLLSYHCLQTMFLIIVTTTTFLTSFCWVYFLSEYVWAVAARSSV